jgi:hypothetical protein
VKRETSEQIGDGFEDKKEFQDDARKEASATNVTRKSKRPGVQRSLSTPRVSKQTKKKEKSSERFEQSDDESVTSDSEEGKAAKHAPVRSISRAASVGGRGPKKKSTPELSKRKKKKSIS